MDEKKNPGSEEKSRADREEPRRFDRNLEGGERAGDQDADGDAGKAELPIVQRTP